MALLTIRDLSLGYDNRIIAEHIDFVVNPGDYLFIVGKNGSGKSTLMKTLLGLQKPAGGEILAGEGLNDNDLGYLPQQTMIQKDFPASVREIVLSGCLGRSGLRPFFSRSDKTAARKNLERMGIEDLENRCYRELSGGQQQRVLLARALCATGKLLLLDEPVSGLDPTASEGMYELVAKLNAEGLAVIMISHDVNAAMRYASHILHLGDDTFFGTKAEYARSAASKLFSAEREGGVL